MDAAGTFFVSFALLIAFLVFRLKEERRGKKLWADARAKADTVVAGLYHGAVTGSIPDTYRDSVVHFAERLAHDSVVFLVEGLRALERPLARLSYRLRQHAPRAVRKDPSEFLKTITVEKKTESTDTQDRV